MKELNDYTKEVSRRVELRVQTQRQHRIKLLAICVPLVLCVVVGAIVLPPVLRRDRAAPPGGEAGLAAAPQQAQPGDTIQAGVDGEPVSGDIVTEDMPTEDGLTEDVPTEDVPTEAADGIPAEDVFTSQEPAGAEQEPAEGVEGIGTEPMEGVDGRETDQMEFSSGLPCPEDFSFRFVWGCYGISSYDSLTGELVKTTDATHPEDYVTTLVLSDARRQEIWSLLSALELETYPASYDPYNDPESELKVATEPNRDLILTLRADGREKTVTCRGICLGGPGLQGYDEKARAFLEVCSRLTQLLEQSPEWQALPEYEFFYE